MDFMFFKAIHTIIENVHWNQIIVRFDTYSTNVFFTVCHTVDLKFSTSQPVIATDYFLTAQLLDSTLNLIEEKY